MGRDLCLSPILKRVYLKIKIKTVVKLSKNGIIKNVTLVTQDRKFTAVVVDGYVKYSNSEHPNHNMNWFRSYVRNLKNKGWVDGGFFYPSITITKPKSKSKKTKLYKHRTQGEFLFTGASNSFFDRGINYYGKRHKTPGNRILLRIQDKFGDIREIPDDQLSQFVRVY